MAVSISLRRLLLSSKIYTPSLTIISKSFCSSSSSPGSSAKVSDRIVNFFAIDPQGNKHQIKGLTGQTLLKALTDFNLIDPESHRLEEIEACSADCEVNIAHEWLDKLPLPTYNESYVLKTNARRGIRSSHARLGCQVILTPDLEDMIVAVPEPKPWDIP